MRWKHEVFLAVSLSMAIISLPKPAPAEEIKWFAACDSAPFTIQIQSASTLIAQSFGTNRPRGALVVGLDPNNSASCGGPEVGELILKFDGREVNDSADLIKIADAAKIGKELPVVVLRDGAQKTKVLKLAPPPPTLRRLSCEELLSLPRVQVPTGAVEQLFGKRFDYMRLTEFDQAISIVNDCIDLHRRTNRLVGTPTQLIIALNSLQARQRGRVAREKLEREGNDAEVRRRLETELRLTQARIAAEQAEAQRRFEAEQRSAELLAKADDCRRHCPQKLSDMVRELRSLGTAEGGVNRFRELGLEYQTMVGEMPIDIKQGLAADMERFASLLQEYEPIMHKAEKDLEAQRLAEEEKLRQKKLEAEEELRQEKLKEAENLRQKKLADERRSQLALFYVLYMQLQFCAERFPNFLDAKATARDIAKNMESEFSTAEITEIWRATAQSFANLEPLLKTTPNLFGECIGGSNALAGMVLSGQGRLPHTQGPRKDF